MYQMFSRVRPITSKAPKPLPKSAPGSGSSLAGVAVGGSALAIGGIGASSIAGISSQAIGAGAAIGGAVIARETLNDVLSFASENPLLIAGIGIVALLIILR